MSANRATPMRSKCMIRASACTWNVSFAQEMRVDEFRARELLVGSNSREGTRALARATLMMEPSEYATAFKGSAIKRAKLWMRQRNACVVLGNVGTGEDLAVLEAMLAHEHAITRDHAAWALDMIRRRL